MEKIEKFFKIRKINNNKAICEQSPRMRGYVRLNKATQGYTRLHKATQGLHKSSKIFVVQFTWP